MTHMLDMIGDYPVTSLLLAVSIVVGGIWLFDHGKRSGATEVNAMYREHVKDCLLYVSDGLDDCQQSPRLCNQVLIPVRCQKFIEELEGLDLLPKYMDCLD